MLALAFKLYTTVCMSVLYHVDIFHYLLYVKRKILYLVHLLPLLLLLMMLAALEQFFFLYVHTKIGEKMLIFCYRLFSFPSIYFQVFIVNRLKINLLT